MRPERLVMDAFGPFANRQVVDFRELGAESLFLISGETGAGKTFILDAFFFGLFGEPCGVDRKTRSLRSDHAAPDRLTRVLVDFRIGPDTYRVDRIPEQQRPKKRGEGLTTQKSEATLWRRTGLLDDAEEGHVLEDGFSNVNRKIKELLGLDAGQYRKTGILPQGEFREVLRSDKSREAILAQLFATQRYQELTDGLQRRTDAIKAEMSESLVKEDQILRTAGCEDREALVQRVREEQAKISAEALKVEELTRVAEEASEALQGGQRQQDALRELAEARATAERMEAQREAMDAQRIRLQEAERAASLEDVIQQAREANDDRDRAERDLGGATEALKAARVQGERLAELEGALQAQAPERETLNKRIATLESARTRVEQWTQAQSAEKASEAAASAAQRQAEAAASRLTGLQAQLETHAAQLGEVRLIQAGGEGAQRALEGANKALSDRRRLEETLEQMERALGALNQAQVALKEADDQAHRAHEEMSSLTRARLLGQASVLAEQLETDHPCPVCGATDHPSPAEAGKDTPGAERLEEAQRKLEATQRALMSHRDTVSEAQTLHAKFAGSLDSLKEQLGATAERPIEELQLEAKTAAERATAAETAERRLVELEKQGRSLESSQAEVTRLHDMAQEAHRKADQDMTAARATTQALADGVEEAYRAPGALEAAIEGARTEKQRRDAELAEATQKSAEARSRVAACEATEKAHARILERAREQATEKSALVAERLKGAGFEDLASWEAAHLDLESFRALKESLERWDRDRTTAQGRLSRATEGAEGVTPPDMELLRRRHEEAARVLGDHRELLGNLRNHHGQMARHLQDLDQLALERGEKDKAYKLVGRLAETAKGKNGGKLTFERYVLAAMLDRVLRVANEHLARMTGGRYRLQRAQYVDDKRTRGGLDLDVYDFHTGDPRSAGTLSGGEGFQASLSLALGMADCVQSQAGGIHLEAIFVDEGFGTLGASDLDAVMKVLEGLREGGRLVGVISHIKLLKERIHARLEVDKGVAGSEARFGIP